MHYQIIFYIPANAKEKVKEAMFAAGAGTIGHYRRCAFETKGEGQFEPLEGSTPHLGSQGVLEKCEEFRVELVCADQYLPQVLHALISHHPYEEPAYSYYPINDKL